MAVVLGLVASGMTWGSAWAQTPDLTGGAFDGNYVGKLTQTSKGCLSGAGMIDSQNVRLHVQNGAFPWTINKVRTMVPIGKNGEIETKTPYIELRGKAAGKVLEWDSINTSCFNKWHFEKQ
jgi:hypothetical protein